MNKLYWGIYALECMEQKGFDLSCFTKNIYLDLFEFTNMMILIADALIMTWQWVWCHNVLRDWVTAFSSFSSTCRVELSHLSSRALSPSLCEMGRAQLTEVLPPSTGYTTSSCWSRWRKNTVAASKPTTTFIESIVYRHHPNLAWRRKVDRRW